MTNLQLWDDSVMLVVLIAPIVLIWRFRVLGIVSAAAFQWIVLIVEGRLLSHWDPQREGGLLDSLWIVAGWIFCLGYCGAIFGGTVLLKRILPARWRAAKIGAEE